MLARKSGKRNHHPGSAPWMMEDINLQASVLTPEPYFWLLTPQTPSNTLQFEQENEIGTLVKIDVLTHMQSDKCERMFLRQPREILTNVFRSGDPSVHCPAWNVYGKGNNIFTKAPRVSSHGPLVRLVRSINHFLSPHIYKSVFNGICCSKNWCVLKAPRSRWWELDNYILFLGVWNTAFVAQRPHDS